MGAWQRAKEQMICLLLCLTYTFILIVNNGNIYTDGTNSRKYLQRKYDEM